ncbi:sensor histidine kinase [Winogradskyella eximia]|uniref:sensor histidine kinase n=1 Tax=Winogradskyella eximia TaxID=262006 RepID=UPI002492CAA3|nr:sensor histidine kinase [Winogradskyella eximia]
MYRKPFFLCLFLLSFLLEAQQPVSVHLTEKDGLPDKEFYNIIEDSKGFIWLTADKGLFRYDGKIFKNYSNPEKRGLSVFEPVEDYLGRVWCNNISGQFFYVENDQLVTFIDLGKELKGELSSFMVTKKHLIVFTKFKIYYVNLSSKEVTLKFTTEFQYGPPITSNETILFGNCKSLFSLNTKEEKEELLQFNFSVPKENRGNAINQKTELFQLKSLLFSRENYKKVNTFFKLDIDTNTQVEVKGLEELKNNENLKFFENDGQLWVATNNGVFVFSFKNDLFKLEKHFLQEYFVTKVIKDKDDNFWLTTLNNGVFVMPNIHVEHLNVSEENSNISCLEKIDNNTLLFGTNKGDIVFYDTKKHEEYFIDLPLAERVSAIKYHPEKELIYISKDVSGFLMDYNTKRIESIKNFFTAKSFSIIDHKDLLFVNYANASLITGSDFNKVNKEISANKRAYTSFYSLISKTTYVAFVDDLRAYDDQWKPNNIRYKDQSIFALSLSETPNGIVWVGTFKEGVFGIKNNEVVYHFTTENGLISNRIEKIKADQNNLWVAADNGIQVIDVETNKIKTLTKRDGVVSYDISGIEILENKVYFSSNKGIFCIDKVKAFKPEKQPKVYFTQVEINEQEVALKSDYTLNYNQNSIKFGFNVNGFQFNQKGKYAYRLLGLNDDWITTETGINSVKYNSLSAGNYTFQVKPVLDVESEENCVEELKFSISRPFWKTWWFMSGISILVLGSTVLYFRRKIKKKEQQRQIEVKQLSLDNELIALKLENLRSQMNPHFIFNALNSIQEYIVLNQKILATIYLGKFADLIRTYLNHSTKGKITLQEEIDSLEMYLELEKLRFEDKLNYTITATGSLKPDQVNIPTMLIQPYVENALKHGLLHRKDDRVLEISFFINEDSNTVRCLITDNGVGREKAEEFKARSHKNHKSFATKATQDRLALLNYGKQKQIGITITDLFEAEKPTGTKVDITIPFTK